MRKAIQIWHNGAQMYALDDEGKTWCLGFNYETATGTCKPEWKPLWWPTLPQEDATPSPSDASPAELLAAQNIALILNEYAREMESGGIEMMDGPSALRRFAASLAEGLAEKLRGNPEEQSCKRN